MNENKESEICKGLRPLGRILEQPDYNVWCCSPIYGPDGKVHVFYSRWHVKYGFNGWVSACEVMHAVADSPEGPYSDLGIALKGSGGDNWDSWSIHNPTVYQVGDKYILLYMGSDGSGLGFTQEESIQMSTEEFWPYYNKLVESKRVGMAITSDLNLPWERVGDSPMIMTGSEPSWDDFCTSNPAFAVTPEGKYRIYYKGWDHRTHEAFHGNRKYGFAEADNLEGPYVKYANNPVIDFSHIEEKMQCEDAFVWVEDGEYKIILRDMGFYNHEYGLYMHSQDGILFSDPQIAYKEAIFYFDENLPGLERQGRLERPQLLMKAGRPEYLFCAFRGGKYKTSSAAVLEIVW